MFRNGFLYALDIQGKIGFAWDRDNAGVVDSSIKRIHAKRGRAVDNGIAGIQDAPVLQPMPAHPNEQVPHAGKPASVNQTRDWHLSAPHDKVDELICTTADKDVLSGDSAPFRKSSAQSSALRIGINVGEFDVAKSLADLHGIISRWMTQDAALRNDILLQQREWQLRTDVTRCHRTSGGGPYGFSFASSLTMSSAALPSLALRISNGYRVWWRDY